MKQIRKTWFFVLVLTMGCPLTALGAPYDLGELPENFEVLWPKRPKIERRTEVASAEEFNQAAATPGTKVVVMATIPTMVQISASNIDVRMAPDVTVHGVTIRRQTQRIRFRGGQIGSGGITMEYPSTFYPTRVTDAEWVIRDVMFDGVSVEADADSSALNLRGERVAVINSHLRGGEYAIWSDTSEPLQSSDVIIAGNVLEAEGDQATLRLVGVRHAVTVDNRLENLMLTGRKHNFRVHAASDQVYAARNLLVNAGTMFGTMDGDDIGELWFEDNVIHHVTDDLFHPDQARVVMLHASNNVAYSARTCFMCFTPKSSWTVDDNALFPYEPAPSQ